MGYYAENNNLTLTNTQSIGDNSILDIYASTESSNQVWNLYIPEGTHSWPDECYTGFDINALVLEFLDVVSN